MQRHQSLPAHHRTIKRASPCHPGLWALGLAACAALGCSDPNDPRTWAKKLDNLRTRNEALDNLERMAPEKARAALPELRALYESTKDPIHLRAIARLQDPASVDLFEKELDFSSDSFESAEVAAGFLGDIKATSAIDKLGAAVTKKLPIKSRANTVRLTSIRALARIGDRKATPFLTEVLTASADEQDFLLNRTAALALAELGDPASIPALIKGLFITGRGANVFQECRLALVRIGALAVDPLIALLSGKNAEINLMARQQEFAENGVIPYKAAYVLGDLRADKAIGPLKALLGKPKQGPEHSEALLTLGKIGTAEAVDELIAVLKDGKREWRTRLSASSGLFLSGDPRAITELLEIARSGYIEIDGEKASNLRATAAIDFSRLAGKEHYDAFNAIAEKETEAEGIFGEALDRMQVARECDKDIACFGKQLADPSWTRAEKAALSIGFSGNAKDGIPLLLAALKPLKTLQHERFPVHQSILYALRRLADKTCTACIAKLEEQIEKDKGAVRIPGAQGLLGDDYVTLATIKNK
jgi:HEAT repeat protein